LKDGEKPNHAWLIGVAATEVLNWLMLPFHHVKDDCPEIAGNTQVTCAGLKELAGLKSLQTLDLAGTKVMDAGVAELRKALPDLKIPR
jgi:hypothetical protein